MKTSIIELQNLYETDYIQWLQETIKQLGNRQLENLDYENLIEELESLGKEQKNAVENLTLQVIIHLLLYQYWQQEKLYNAKHWRGEIITFRTQLQLRMTTNLKNHLLNRLNYLYSKARKIAQVKSELILPHTNPYTLEQILDEDWLPQ